MSSIGKRGSAICCNVERISISVEETECVEFSAFPKLKKKNRFWKFFLIVKETKCLREGLVHTATLIGIVIATSVILLLLDENNINRANFTLTLLSRSEYERRVFIC